jgi:hypothetical protein
MRGAGVMQWVGEEPGVEMTRKGVWALSDQTPFRVAVIVRRLREEFHDAA